jgi:hypothetical protein
MFIEVSKISTILKCRSCKNPFGQMAVPRVLPCGKSVCQKCIETWGCSSNHIQSLSCLCSKNHTIPGEGLPINKIILKLLSIPPIQVSRGKSFEQLKNELNKLQAKISSLSTDFEIILTNYFTELKTQLKNSKNALSDPNIFNKASEQITVYEAKCSNNARDLKSNKPVIENLKEYLKTFKTFHSTWTQYLEKTKTNEDEILTAIVEASKLNEIAIDAQLFLNEKIFGQACLKLRKNYLEHKSNGMLEYERTNLNINSTIISKEKMIQLLKLCRFDYSQKFLLLYRASRDGFEAENFHLKCDKQRNTLIIIRSESGNVFGGYTERNWKKIDWRTEAFQADSDAFLFSFINDLNEPYVLKCENPSKAITCFPTYGPIFGDRDLVICSKSNIIEQSCSILGNVYKKPINTPESLLAGSTNFKTTEIEVYTKVLP